MKRVLWEEGICVKNLIIGAIRLLVLSRDPTPKIVTWVKDK